MNKKNEQQNKLVSSNDLFYLPTDKYSKQSYSENFIKLFQNALNKIYSPKNTSPSKEINLEASQEKNVISSKSIEDQKPLKKPSVSSEKSGPFYLTERQRLIKEILNGKTELSTNKNKNLISKRCKTLENNEANPELNDNCGDSPKNSPRPKIPLKLRQAFHVNRSKSKNNNGVLPPIMDKMSPNSKKNIFENLHIINKYRQLEAQYRSNEFLSTPIEIFSVSSPSEKAEMNPSKINIGISKLTKQSIIRSKSRKIKYSLEGISHQLKNFDQDSKRHQLSKSYRLDSLINESELFEKICKESQRKILENDIYYPGLLPIGHNLLRKNKRKQLKAKEPLDEYFKPWENSEEMKRYSQFSSNEIFSNTKSNLKTIQMEECD